MELEGKTGDLLMWFRGGQNLRFRELVLVSRISMQTTHTEIIGCCGGDDWCCSLIHLSTQRVGITVLISAATAESDMY